MILITGASGKTGKAIIQALTQQNKPCRAFIRDNQKTKELKSLGASEVFIGDLLNKQDLLTALKGANALYHICPNMHPQEIHIGESIIQAAKAASINHFVYHSVLRPQIKAMPHHWNKMRVEEKLFKSGLNFTILQPAAYYQNIFGLIQDKTISLPYNPDAKLSMVDLDDVAEVAAKVIGSPKHFNAVYELCGPKPISHTEIAAILGKDYEVSQISIREWRGNVERVGLGEYQITTLIKMFDYYQKHGFVGSGNTLTWLLGRPPNDFKSILNKKADA